MQWREKIKILNNSEFESLENLAKTSLRKNQQDWGTTNYVKI